VLGVLWATPLEEGDGARVLALAREAMRRGLDVGVFVMCAAVCALDGPEVDALLDAGADVVACANDAAAYGVARRGDVVWGGQADLAVLVARAERMVTFA